MSDMNPPVEPDPPGGSGFPPPPPPPPPPPGGGYAPPPSYAAGAGGASYSVAPGIERAGFGPRFVAWILDIIIVGIAGGILRGALGAVGQILGLVLGLAYYGYFEGGPAGQTVGKKVMNLRVVRVDNGGELGWGPALIRYVCRILSAIPCGLGYFWMLWDKDKMTWHDKLSQTLVVPTSVAPVPADAFGKPPKG